MVASDAVVELLMLAPSQSQSPLYCIIHRSSVCMKHVPQTFEPRSSLWVLAGYGLEREDRVADSRASTIKLLSRSLRSVETRHCFR